MTSPLLESHSRIRSREDFAVFVRALREDLKGNPQDWENDTLDRYLEAMSAWVENMNAYFLNQGRPTPEQPDWKLLGDILMAARIYE